MKNRMNNRWARRPSRGVMCLVNSALRRTRKGARDEKGAAAIEFTLVFPFLLMLLVGSIEMFMMSMASRKMTRVASTVGDLVTQAKGTLSKSAIDDYFKVAKYIMGKFGDQDLALSIFTFTKDDPNRPPRLAWRHDIGNYTCESQQPQLSADQLAAMEDGNDLVITYGCYKYKVKVGKLVFGNLQLTMKDDISLRPRQRMKLPCSDCS